MCGNLLDFLFDVFLICSILKSDDEKKENRSSQKDNYTTYNPYIGDETDLYDEYSDESDWEVEHFDDDYFDENDDYFDEYDFDENDDG